MAKKASHPTVNIGLVGHVDHGKTTLTQRLSGKWTDTHSEELKRGITIRLGYANTTFYKIPGKRGIEAYTTEKKTDGKANTLQREVSFVDAPGHESLMATMLSGAAIMDGAILLVAANEKCPQPQTREHLMALDIVGIEKVVVVQNKIDLVTEEEALENYKQIQAFLKGTRYENAPIIPISAQQGINIDALIAAIEETITTPSRADSEDSLFFVARSFDINRPGTEPNNLVGGVLGGAVASGSFEPGTEIEIKPGRRFTEAGQIRYEPIKTTITSVRTGSVELEAATPGGSAGIMTMLDPAVVKSDSLSGSVVGPVGKTPPTRTELVLEIHLLDRVVGSKDDLIVEPLREREPLVLNVNTATTVGQITKLGKKEATISLKLPVAAPTGSKITFSRRFHDRWRLIGYGILKG